ncbi:MAG: hypothetical protein LBE12_14430 [Planctomycetaceae bacterium]|jgi:hypothetical protein|nr:hypothetical protein [Planctomycetaceae bacterium]
MMQRFFFYAAFFCAAVFLLFVLFSNPVQDVHADSSTEPNKHLLRYRFQKGNVLRWNVLQSLKIRTSVSGVEEVVETTSRSTKVWTVISVDNKETATFEYLVGDVNMRQFQTDKDGAKIAEYNSRKDKNIPGAFINLDGTIGVPLAHISIDVLGKTSKKPLRIYSGSTSTENRIVIPLPKEPVAVGDSWSAVIPVEIKQSNGTVKKINARQEFTLFRVHSGIAVIKFVTQILTPLTPKEESQILDKFSSGKMELDLDAGHFIRQETTIDKHVIGFQGAGDNIHYLARLTECCCGLNSCELCSPKK